jgi:hypothetical protein
LFAHNQSPRDQEVARGLFADVSENVMPCHGVQKRRKPGAVGYRSAMSGFRCY